MVLNHNLSYTISEKERSEMFTCIVQQTVLEIALNGIRTPVNLENIVHGTVRRGPAKDIFRTLKWIKIRGVCQCVHKQQ